MRAAIVTALCVVAWSGAARADGVKWQESTLPAALAQAKHDGKWVLVDLYATWCVPCQQMDADVYNRDETARAIAAGYVPLRRDGEAGEGVQIVERYHVLGFPTVLVLDAEGVEVDRFMGAMSSAELILHLMWLHDGKGTLAEAEATLARAPTDALRLLVGTRHAMRVDARAVAELEEVVRRDADNHAKRAAAALLTLGKLYYLRGQHDYARAQATLLELEQRFPDSDEAVLAPYERAIALQRSGHPAEARSTLDAWLARAPNDRDRISAYAWFCFKENGDRARGIEVAKRGLTLAPKDDALWDTLGELYLASSDRPDATRAFAQASSLSPKNDYYRRQVQKAGGVP